MKVVDETGLKTVWAATKSWVTTFVNEKINESTSTFISSSASAELPFDHCTFILGSPNLENGPWYKNGKEISSTNNIQPKDYTNVLNDESVCYSYIKSYRYQRQKDGAFAQGSYGYITLANNARSYIKVTPTMQMYFIDDSRLVFTDMDVCLFVSSFTQLKSSVKVYEWKDNLTDTLAGDVILTAELFYPTTKYVCTSSAEFDEDGNITKNPTFSFNMIVNDSALSSEQLSAINSGITSTLVANFSNYSSTKQDTITETNKLSTNLISGLGKVATSDNYNDLYNKPTIPSVTGLASETYVSNEISKLNIPTRTSDITNDSNFQTADQVASSIASKLSSVYKYKGSVENYSDLPENAEEGDVYNVLNQHDNVPAGTNYAWEGENWDALAGTIDLSVYYTKEEAASKEDLTTKVDKEIGKGLSSNDFTSEEKNKLDSLENVSISDQVININATTKKIDILTNEDGYLPISQINNIIYAYNDLVDRVNALENK